MSPSLHPSGPPPPHTHTTITRIAKHADEASLRALLARVDAIIAGAASGEAGAALSTVEPLDCKLFLVRKLGAAPEEVRLVRSSQKYSQKCSHCKYCNNNVAHHSGASKLSHVKRLQGECAPTRRCDAVCDVPMTCD
jgi:hypothetical protein